MSGNEFQALVLRKDDSKTLASIETLSDRDLPDEDVLVAVEYSGLNYKDALAVTGAGPIVRSWPMVPGIDLAGTVVTTDSSTVGVGDRVVLTGWGVGEKYWGGYSQRQRVKHEWLVPLPSGLSTQDAMAVGTAGLTAMLCVMRLEDAGLAPEHGPILVTGASGGVGSVSIAVLAKLGYEVAAMTTSKDGDVHAYLRGLGASQIVSAFDISEKAKPLETQKWAGAVDTVGSKILARVLSQVQYGGAVAACGLAAGPDLPSSVMPFILRNVSLLGVDSVMCPNVRRIKAWERIATDLSSAKLARISHVERLADVPELAKSMLAGHFNGRVVIEMNQN